MEEGKISFTGIVDLDRAAVRPADLLRDLLAVPLGVHPRETPLHGVYPKPGTLNVLSVDAIAGILWVVDRHPVVDAVVGHFLDVIKAKLGSRFLCYRVLCGKFGMLRAPQ